MYHFSALVVMQQLCSSRAAIAQRLQRDHREAIDFLLSTSGVQRLQSDYAKIVYRILSGRRSYAVITER
jgi:hypothetical protein